MKFCVYAIQSTTTGRIYIGQTADFEKRLAQHNCGAVISTQVDAPWHAIKVAFFDTREAARFFEWQLKKSRWRRLKWLAT